MANSTVLSIDPNFLLLDTYSVSDETLIANQEVTSTFDPQTDYIEYYIYGLNNSLLYPSLEDGTVPYSLYSILDNDVYIDPSLDLQTFGFGQGGYNVLYNFYSNRLSSSFSTQYFISEISSDRTEIRLDSNEIEDEDIISSVNAFIAERQADEFFPDFLLNFGSNRTVIANNIALDGNTVLIKLYEPLPAQFNVKSTLWVVEEVAEPTAYNVTFAEEILEEEDSSILLKGPNLNLSVKDEVNNSTEATSLADLNESSLTSSYQQLESLFGEEGVQINVDYTEYSNFTHFSSVKARLENFEYKLQLIESYREAASSGSNTTNTVVSSSTAYYESLIDDVITNFDGYEYFLYFESGSKSWPKSNSTPPYENLPTDDTAAETWYSEQISSASIYDELNQDNLYYNIPEYLRNDSQNDQYIEFIEMIGQHFDNIWIYLKDISNKYNADNRIDAGISKDLVAQVLRDFSLKIYQNNFSSRDIYSSFLGLTPSGSLFPFPEMTGSLPTPSGFEYVDTFISSSTDAIPLDDINKRIYKRLYHNLPYLLKSKGTISGLKSLLNIYGIPNTILDVSEFGGKDKDNSNDYDYWQQKYNYQYDNEGRGYINTEWSLNPAWGAEDDVPHTVMFRFKADLESGISDVSQSLWCLDDGTQFSLGLEYSGTGNTSGSFSGSIADPEKYYAKLNLTPDGFANTASVELPFYDGGWWSVMVNFRDTNHFDLYAANKIYNGGTGTGIGFYASSSTTADPSTINTAVSSSFPTLDGLVTPLGYEPVSASYQEVKYFTTAISASVFEDYVMNPQSIEGNSLNSSPSELAFRATLGGELYSGSVSIHPKVTGSWAATSSFTNDSNFTVTEGEFGSNVEYVFLDQPAVGIKNRINDKIRSVDLSLPTYNTTKGALVPDANTLSNQRSVQQDKVRDDIYTNNIDALEVTFSPQNEINDDIIAQLGYFNLGDYIGDPREISSSNQTYPELDSLRQDYFLKYVHENYDFNDYVRLIKFFDNSLFKMIKDFVPAKTSLASGITIKPTILERYKYPQPQASWEDQQYSGSVKSFPRGYETGSVEVVEGGDGGSFETFNNLTNFTQSWSGSRNTAEGIVDFTVSDAPEFITGEFSGSHIIATNGELNSECDIYKDVDTTVIRYNGTCQAETFNNGENVTSTGTSLVDFVNRNFGSPDSTMGFWFKAERSYNPPNPFSLPFDVIDTYAIERVNIQKTSTNSVDLESYIPSAKKIIFQLGSAFPNQSFPGGSVTDNIGTNFELEVTNVKEFDDYYSLEIRRNSALTFVTSTNVGVSPWTVDRLDFNFFSGPNIVLEPYIKKDFLVSNCNPIYGSATDIRPGTLYQDVDYSSNATTPVNFGQLISGSATKANIPDSNYSTKRITLPRYEGSRSTSNNFNENSNEGGLGALPNVEQDRAYFAYFNWVGGTSPEWGNGLVDRSGLSVRYFIDADGNVIEPTKDSKDVNLSIVRQTFTEGEIGVLTFDDESGTSANFSNLIGEQVIFKSGKTIAPILYTQTGSISSDSNGGYTGSIEFGSGDVAQSGSNIEDFQLYSNISSTAVPVASGLSVPFADVVNSGSELKFITPFESASIDPPHNPSANNITLYITYQLYAPLQSGVQAVFEVYKNNNPTGVNGTLDASNPYYRGLSLNYTDASSTTDDSYEVVVTSISGGPSISLDSTSYFRITQQPLPTTGDCTRFWTQVGVSSNQIKALGVGTGNEGGLSQFYGQKQKDIEGSGFFPITLDFTVEPGDEIRFQGTETQTYKVISVDSSSDLVLTLDRDVTATNLDWFLLRRYVDAPGTILIEADKPAGGTSPGFFMPLYSTKGIEENFDKIIQKLKMDQLL